MLLVGFLLSAGLFAAAAAGQTGTVRGRVEDGDGRPVARAVVYPLWQEQGGPITPAGTPWLQDHQLNPVLRAPHFAVTDKGGRFEFAELPVGTWRLVAQSWPGRGRRGDPFQRNGAELQLHGVQDGIQVGHKRSLGAVLRPLGDGELLLDVKVPNNDTMLFLSLGAPSGDGLLGLALLRGEFLGGLVGAMRLPQGKVRVRGLPRAVSVHALAFHNDNIPRSRLLEVSCSKRRIVRQVLSFARPLGRRRLPDNLEAVRKELGGAQAADVLAAVGLLPKADPKTPFSLFVAMARAMEEPVELPSGKAVPAADLLALMWWSGRPGGG